MSHKKISSMTHRDGLDCAPSQAAAPPGRSMSTTRQQSKSFLTRTGRVMSRPGAACAMSPDLLSWLENQRAWCR